MDLDAFDKGPGRLEVGSKGYFYHVPAPPPTGLADLGLSQETLRLLSLADRQVGRLDGVAEVIPNPQLLIRPYMRKEAVLSSRIEGTKADEGEVAVEEISGAGEEVSGTDVREVGNFIRAMDYGIRQVGNQRVDLVLLREMHAILMEGVRGHDKDPGRFRDVQVYIGSHWSSIEDATYVPPEPRVMKECLHELEKRLKGEKSLPILVECALMHYWFEAIHPFRDGNGRIGRALIQLMLLEEQVMRQPLLYISAFFEKNRQKYYDHLQSVSTDGTYDEWVKFFLNGVVTQARDGVEKSRRIISLLKTYHEDLKMRGANQAAHRIVENVFENLATTMPIAAKHSEVSYQTAQRAIEDYLVPAGILREATGKRRNRVYVAPDLLKVLQE